MRATRPWLGIWACSDCGSRPTLWADDEKPPPKDLAWVPADSAGFTHCDSPNCWTAPSARTCQIGNYARSKDSVHLEQQIGLPLRGSTA